MGWMVFLAGEGGMAIGPILLPGSHRRPFRKQVLDCWVIRFSYKCETHVAAFSPRDRLSISVQFQARRSHELPQ